MTEKKSAKKRLSDEQAKDDADQEPRIISTDSPRGLVECSPPPKVPLIQPKTEPEEQESNSQTTCFVFHIPVTHLC